jgi:hypothetical protein
MTLTIIQLIYERCSSPTPDLRRPRNDGFWEIEPEILQAIEEVSPLIKRRLTLE